jgi:hypothetical protein
MILTGKTYWELVSSDLGERAWEHEAQLRATVADDGGDPRARALAAAVLDSHDAGGVPPATLADAYVGGLRAGAFSDFANPWGVPGAALGPVGTRVAALGEAAVPALRAALDDDAPLRFSGSREAAIGNGAGWRVKDAAATVLAAIVGRPFAGDDEPAARDEAIKELRT